MKPKPHKAIDWKKIAQNDLRVTAYHEAGHAIVCKHFHIPYILNYLKPTKATLEKKGAIGQIGYFKVAQVTPFRCAVIGWAGVMATALLEGDDEQNCFDYHDTNNLDELSPTDATAVRKTRFRWRALTTAARILRRRWDEVENKAAHYLE